MTNSKQRVLVLASTYPRWAGDYEPGFIHELAKRLSVQFDVTVLCPHAKGAAPRERLDGVDVVRYRYAPAGFETLVNDGGIVTNLKLHRWKLMLVPGFIVAQAWSAIRLCRREKVDVVHAHWLLPQGLVATVLGKPFLLTSHGADLYALQSRSMQTLKRFVLHKASATTVVSSAMLNVIQGLGGDVSKVSVVPMGVDMSKRFAPDDLAPRSRSELLFVGRLVEKKGLRYLLDVLPMVRNVRADVTLTIAGFGPEERRLRSQVNDLGLQEVVRFLGPVAQPDLPHLYRRAAVFVAPFVRAESGDQEGLPVALMEAVACGCPAIAGDVAGLLDIFGPRADECVVNPRDSRALTAAILRRLQQPDKAVAESVAMRAALQERLSWDHIARRYADLLQGLR